MTTADRIREEERRSLLLRLLAARFGELPAAVTARVGDATADELGQWVIAVLTAPSLDAVFATH